MPYKDKRTGKWIARVQVNNKRFRIGSYRTKKEAQIAEDAKQKELKRLMNKTLDKQKLSYEETDHPLHFKALQLWFKQLRKQRAKDKAVREQLEQL